jgi:membrane-bound serine protease (ClpP class)
MLASLRAPVGTFFLAGLLLATFLLATSMAVPASAENSVPDATRERPAKVSRPAVIEMYGEIDGKLTTYFKSRFEQARSADVDLLIIDIDSPGGLKIESLEMARMLRDCDWAYTVAVVGNEAISGAALISIGCDAIYIDPNAKFGDIGEIAFDMEQWAWRLIEPKIESYLSRDARDLAESKGRPADLAEAMVDKEVLVYRKPKEDAAGEFEFTSVRTDEELKPEAPWELVPETGPERFLTLSGQRAKELGIAQEFASSVDELSEEYQYDAANLRRFRYTTTDTVVYRLNQPVFTGLLILIGLIALYIEASAPGIGIGGLVAGLCAVLFFWSRFLTGTSGWLEVIDLHRIGTVRDPRIRVARVIWNRAAVCQRSVGQSEFCGSSNGGSVEHLHIVSAGDVDQRALISGCGRIYFATFGKFAVLESPGVGRATGNGRC